MKNTIIENTDIELWRVSRGTASLHNVFSACQRQKLIQAGATAGITHFDTSPYYGYGLAETDLGVFLRGHRAAYTVATKVGLYPLGAASSVASSVWARKALGRLVPRISLPVVNWQVGLAGKSLNQSLRRLRTDYVDFVFLHEPVSALISTDEFVRWIEAEYQRGTVRSWGLAGVSGSVSAWVANGHPLAKVIQTQDSVDKLEADFMFSSGRNLQFTYGYLSSQSRVGQVMEPELIMRKALARNSAGSIIVSSRRADRIVQLARMAS